MTAAEVEDFQRDGFVVLRNAFSAQEIKTLYAPVQRVYESGTATEASLQRTPGTKYPDPGTYPIGSKMLHVAPEVVPLSCSHPVVVRAVSRLLGDRPMLSQYQIYMRTPGSQGTGGSYENPGAGTHYDYKPWRPVGSFLNWLFAVIPLVDYTDEAGPLLVAPGSNRATEVLASDGRVRLVRCGCIPPVNEVGKVMKNPGLKAGDLMLMHGFTWHTAYNNISKGDRVGIYMKFHGVHSPPAMGPLIQPAAAKQFITASGAADVIGEHFRSDGKFAEIVSQPDGGSGPQHTVDQARIILERPADGHVLLVEEEQNGRVVRRLPGCLGQELDQYTPKKRDSLGYLDVGNVIGPLTDHVRELLGFEMPFVSWVADHHAPGSSLEVSRIYGYRLHPSEAEKLAALPQTSSSSKFQWVHPDAIRSLGNAEEFEFQGQEVLWSRMWINEADERGEPVLRGIALKHAVQDGVQGTYNGAGGTGQNGAGGYVVGERLLPPREGWRIVPPPPRKKD